MKQKLLLISIFLLIIKPLSGQELSVGRWNDFTGKLGNFDIRLSVYPLKNGQLKGNYCYHKYGTRIPLIGETKNGQIILKELLNNAENARFTGRFLSDSADRFAGEWTKADSTKTYHFDLVLDAITYGEPAKKYRDFKSSDLMVEQYASKIKSAVLKGDKYWLANQINYPLKTSFGDQQMHTIKSKSAFIANYSKVFHARFVDRIKNTCTCNLFYDQDGAMLGEGDIWIDEYVHPPKGKNALFILGINN